MIDEIVIRQEAKKVGITVSAAEIDEAMKAAFGYYPNGTPTPTVTPTHVLTPTLNPTQLAIVTITPTPTTAPTETPEPSQTPVALPLLLTYYGTHFYRSYPHRCSFCNPDSVHAGGIPENDRGLPGPV